MRNTEQEQKTIQQAITAYHSRFGKDAEPPHEAYSSVSGDQVILASSRNKLAVFNIKDGKISDPVGGFKKS